MWQNKVHNTKALGLALYHRTHSLPSANEIVVSNAKVREKSFVIYNASMHAILDQLLRAPKPNGAWALILNAAGHKYWQFLLYHTPKER